MKVKIKYKVFVNEDSYSGVTCKLKIKFPGNFFYEQYELFSFSNISLREMENILKPKNLFEHITLLVKRHYACKTSDDKYYGNIEKITKITKGLKGTLEINLEE